MKTKKVFFHRTVVKNVRWESYVIRYAEFFLARFRRTVIIGILHLSSGERNRNVRRLDNFVGTRSETDVAIRKKKKE